MAVMRCTDCGEQVDIATDAQARAIVAKGGCPVCAAPLVIERLEDDDLRANWDEYWRLAGGSIDPAAPS